MSSAWATLQNGLDERLLLGLDPDDLPAARAVCRSWSEVLRAAMKVLNINLDKYDPGAPARLQRLLHERLEQVILATEVTLTVSDNWMQLLLSILQVMEHAPNHTRLTLALSEWAYGRVDPSQLQHARRFEERIVPALAGYGRPVEISITSGAPEEIRRSVPLFHPDHGNMAAATHHAGHHRWFSFSQLAPLAHCLERFSSTLPTSPLHLHQLLPMSRLTHLRLQLANRPAWPAHHPLGPQHHPWNIPHPNLLNPLHQPGAAPPPQAAAAAHPDAHNLAQAALHQQLQQQQAAESAGKLQDTLDVLAHLPSLQDLHLECSALEAGRASLPATNPNSFPHLTSLTLSSPHSSPAVLALKHSVSRLARLSLERCLLEVHPQGALPALQRLQLLQATVRLESGARLVVPALLQLEQRGLASRLVGEWLVPLLESASKLQALHVELFATQASAVLQLLQALQACPELRNLAIASGDVRWRPAAAPAAQQQQQQQGQGQGQQQQAGPQALEHMVVDADDDMDDDPWAVQQPAPAAAAAALAAALAPAPLEAAAATRQVTVWLECLVQLQQLRSLALRCEVTGGLPLTKASCKLLAGMSSLRELSGCFAGLDVAYLPPGLTRLVLQAGPKHVLKDSSTEPLQRQAEMEAQLQLGKWQQQQGQLMQQEGQELEQLAAQQEQELLTGTGTGTQGAAAAGGVEPLRQQLAAVRAQQRRGASKAEQGLLLVENGERLAGDAEQQLEEARARQPDWTNARLRQVVLLGGGDSRSPDASWATWALRLLRPVLGELTSLELCCNLGDVPALGQAGRKHKRQRYDEGYDEDEDMLDLQYYVSDEEEEGQHQQQGQQPQQQGNQPAQQQGQQQGLRVGGHVARRATRSPLDVSAWSSLCQELALLRQLQQLRLSQPPFGRVSQLHRPLLRPLVLALPQLGLLAADGEVVKGRDMLQLRRGP